MSNSHKKHYISWGWNTRKRDKAIYVQKVQDHIDVNYLVINNNLNTHPNFSGRHKASDRRYTDKIMLHINFHEAQIISQK